MGSAPPASDVTSSATAIGLELDRDCVERVEAVMAVLGAHADIVRTALADSDDHGPGGA